jgi:tRNA (guanine37-N1)-methyltransferase
VRVSIVTLFPELFDAFLATSMVGRAVRSGAVTVERVALRDHGLGRHRSVDDTPYGGGSGMVLRVEPVVAALEDVDARAASAGAPTAHRVLLTPQGRLFRQPAARELATRPHVALVCGRYEGFDERVRSFVHEEISLGDFVLTGGEIPAMAIVEATARLLPGVLGNEASSDSESFGAALGEGLEYPQYTRPVEFRGLEVPEVLQGGNHAAIDAWRRERSRERTRARRPDLVRDDPPPPTPPRRSRP